MYREQATDRILEARRNRGLTFETDLSVMERDAGALRGDTRTLLATVLHGDGMGEIVAWVRGV